MKKYLYILSFFGFSMLASCEKREVEPIVFGVTVESEVAYVGEEITFHFTGSPDYINFYSGERGNDFNYAYANRINEVADINLSFTTEYYNGVQTDDLLRLFYSKDFNGTYSVEGIDNATWTDITDRCTFPSGISNGSNPLGFANSQFDIIDLFEGAEPTVYFAFRYQARGPHTVYGQRTNARISVFDINYTNDDGHHVFVDHAGADWAFVRYADYEGSSNQFLLEPSRFSFAIGASPAVDRIAYAITKAISLDKQVNEGRDRPILVKNSLDELPPTFSHVFTKAGEYEVVFEVSNVYGTDIIKTTHKVNVKILEE